MPEFILIFMHSLKNAGVETASSKKIVPKMGTMAAKQYPKPSCMAHLRHCQILRRSPRDSRYPQNPAFDLSNSSSAGPRLGFKNRRQAAVRIALSHSAVIAGHNSLSQLVTAGSISDYERVGRASPPSLFLFENAFAN
jgi:hypothetical protein